MRGLMDRLAAGTAGRDQDEVESIVGHLRVLLNTRRGDSVSAPEFGIPDFSDLVHGFPESLALLQQSVKATILQHETRLRNVIVRHVPDEDSLVIRFEISGQLAPEHGNRTLRFRTEVAPGGRVEIW